MFLDIAINRRSLLILFFESFWNRTEMYKALEFDKYINATHYIMDEFVGWGGWSLSDNSFYRQSLEKINREKPFYAFLMTGHHPYSFFEEKQDFSVGKYEKTYLGNYIKAQNYADTALGNFIQRLKDQGLYENSLIVIYGDHTGLPKTQAKDLLEFLNKSDNKLDWYKIQKIPFLIHYAGIEGQVIEKTGGQIDLYPTIANLAGFNHSYAVGKDLLNSNGSYAVFRNGSVITDKYLYLSDDNNVFNMTSGEELNKADYLDEIKMYQNDLYISDLVLEKDAFRRYVP